MVDLIGKICSAIATIEGWYVPGSRPERNHNPGDLRGAPWLVKPQMDGGFWKADSDGQGIAGLYHQVALNIARGWSLKKLVYTWAPPGDYNDSATYLKNVMLATGIPLTEVDTPLQNFLELEKVDFNALGKIK